MKSPFSRSTKPPSSCASSDAPSTTCAGRMRDRDSAATAAVSSTNSATYLHGPNSVGRGLSRQTKPKNRRLIAAAILALGVLALAFPKANVPSLLWNLSPSVPVGLYRLTARPPVRHALAVIRLAEPYNRLARMRSYLPAGAPLIKPVAAGAGDLVCRRGSLVTINGRAVAVARDFDAAGRLLPHWSGCISLGTTQIIVLSSNPDSFDSRYIQAVDRGYVLGTALPIWVRAAPSPSWPLRDAGRTPISALAAF
jgi:conjugative transfer signal peptidase TraF